MSPALIVERFDTGRGPQDQRGLAPEDFCSLSDLPVLAKYDGTIERMARGLRPLSTDLTADLDILFRRTVFAWLIADGDMHHRKAGADHCERVSVFPTQWVSGCAGVAPFGGA